MANNLNYLIGRIRAIEPFLLTEDNFLKILFSKDYDMSLSLLGENKRWAEIIKSVEGNKNFILVLEKMKRNLFQLVGEIANEYREIKTLIYKFEREKNVYENFVIDLRNCSKHSKSHIFKSIVFLYELYFFVKTSLLNGKSPELVSQKIAYKDYSKNILKGIEEYKRTDDLSVLEKEFDNTIMSIAKTAKHKAFGIDPVIGFFIAQEMELKNLKLIFSSKKFGINPEKVKGLLRNSYV